MDLQFFLHHQFFVLNKHPILVAKRPGQLYNYTLKRVTREFEERCSCLIVVFWPVQFSNRPIFGYFLMSAVIIIFPPLKQIKQ